jgi:hypothetical protein
MAIIEYDKSPGISHEQRLQSLADSVRRAFDEIAGELEQLKGMVKEVQEEGGAE